MKVVDLFKHRGETVSKYHSGLVEKVSPAVREYWGEILHKAHNRPFFSWIRDFQQPAVNEDSVHDSERHQTRIDRGVTATRDMATETPATKKSVIELKPEAQAVFDELQTQLGTVIHTGEWLSVDQERINQFGQVTEDMQWIHTDPERAAAESPFKTTIAHGFLTLALLPRLTDSVDPEQNQFPSAKMVVNLGLNQVRFPYPVKAGSRLRAVSTLTKVTPIRKGLEIEREIKVEIEGIRRPAAVVVSVIQLHF